jgi:Rps23 Pro-64 3,4-dihydroxylase Tpa1-like proline 4-hydroxylase
MESILKEELFKKGYISFHLKDFNEKIYNDLIELFPSSELLPESFTNLRNSVIELKRKSPYADDLRNIPFNELEIIKKNILTNYNDGINNTIDQIWYHKWPERKLAEELGNTILIPILKSFYEYDFEGWQSDITMYNDGCFLLNHQDAVDGIRGHCVVLIYLSNDYEKGKGGELIIGNEMEVEPIFGNVAIMDFTKHNPHHAVNRVIGYNRFCYINFC